MERLAGALQEGLEAPGRKALAWRARSFSRREGPEEPRPTEKRLETSLRARSPIPERGRRPRSWLGLLPRGIAHKAIPNKGPHKAAHIPIRIANAILGRAPHGRGSQPVEVEDLALADSVFSVGGEGTPKASRRPRSLFSIEDRYIFSANTNRGRAPMGGGSQRSAAPWQALPPKGGAFFCGLRPDDEKNYQTIGQRSEARCFETQTGSARSNYPVSFGRRLPRSGPLPGMTGLCGPVRVQVRRSCSCRPTGG